MKLQKPMKKLNSINWVAFKEDKLYLEDFPIEVGTNINNWLLKFNELEYSIEKADYNEKRQYIEFVKYKNIIINTFDSVITSIHIYPYEYQSSPYFNGDIFIFDKKLEVPFLSDDIEKYFPNISIKPKGYFKRFTPKEIVNYPVSNTVKIEIMMGRDPELVGSLSLTGL